MAQSWSAVDFSPPSPLKSLSMTRLVATSVLSVCACLLPYAGPAFLPESPQFLGAAPPAHRRALLLMDNSGADAVLGMIPLARELLRRGTDVVMVANSQPAINDITAPELELVLQAAAKVSTRAQAGKPPTSTGRPLQHNGGRGEHALLAQ